MGKIAAPLLLKVNSADNVFVKSNVIISPQICALCKFEKEICDSHIVPEFMYQTVYDKNHSFMVVSLDEAGANQRCKKGIREKLFCKECENKFSKLESYAAEFFLQR